MRLHGRTGGQPKKRREWAFAKGGVGLLVTIRRVVVQLRHHIAMHLTHQDDALLQLKRQQLAVVENRLRVIAHMVAQVQAVIRRQRRPPCPMGAEHLSP